MSAHGLSHDEVMEDFSKNGRDVDDEEAMPPAESSPHQQIMESGAVGTSSNQQRESLQTPTSSYKSHVIARSSSLSPARKGSIQNAPFHSGYINCVYIQPPPSNTTMESRSSASSFINQPAPQPNSMSPLAKISSMQKAHHESNSFWKLPSSSNKTYGQEKRPILKASGEKLCRFCQQNGESFKVYKSHNLKNEVGEVECPILHNYVCPICKATGKKAHTMKYCPRRNSKEVFSISAVQSMRMSNGKMRAQYF